MIVGNPVIVATSGGSVSKPSYLISDGNTVSTFYFNTELALSTYLSALSYPDTDPDTGLDVCALGLGYFFAVDLTGGNYALVWNDGTNIVPVYSTTAVPSYGVASAGWQIPSYTPQYPVTVSMSNVIPALRAIMDNTVAKSSIAFGTKSEALSVSDNGTYNAPNGTLYSSVSVSVSGGGSQPRLNAPTISISGATLSITNPSTNGNFVKGYKIFVNGVQRYTTTGTSYDLSGVSENTAAITVKAYGDDFQDSPSSNSVTYYHQYSVSFYDGSAEMTGSPVIISYGSTVAQTISKGGINTYKSGYSFDAWYSDSALTIEVSDDTQITGNTVLYGKWLENAYITEIATLDISVSAESGSLSTPVISPDGSVVILPFVYKSSNKYNGGIRAYKYVNGAYSAVGTSSQYLLSQGSTAASAKTGVMWINDSLLIAVSYGLVKVFSYDGTLGLRDVTSTYIPSGFSIGSYVFSNLSMNSSGKLVIKQNVNSSFYILDTTVTPFAAQTVTWTSTNSVWIMSDNNLVAVKDSSIVGKTASDYSAAETTLMNYYPGRGSTSWKQSGDNLSYFGIADAVGTSQRGCYRLLYSNGTMSSGNQKILGSSYASDAGATYNIDGYWIVASASNIDVYDTSGLLEESLQLSANISPKFISASGANGTVIVAPLATYKQAIVFRLAPKTS